MRKENNPESFTEKVVAVIRKIPHGRVATYQQVAGLAGRPQASRAVATILKAHSKDLQLPWQRVISSQGKIAFKPDTINFLLQKRLLKSEGVEVLGRSGQIDLSQFQYRKKAAGSRKRNRPRIFS